MEETFETEIDEWYENVCKDKRNYDIELHQLVSNLLYKVKDAIKASKPEVDKRKEPDEYSEGFAKGREVTLQVWEHNMKEKKIL